MQVLQSERNSSLYLCRVKLRRGEGWNVKPRSEKIDGMVAWFYAMWDITEDDSGIYAGEVAMGVEPRQGVSIPGWVASGDLELLEKTTMLAAAMEACGEPAYPRGTECVFEAGKPPRQIYSLEEILKEL